MVKLVVLLRQGCKFNLDGLSALSAGRLSADDGRILDRTLEPPARNISTNSNIA